MYDLVCYTYLHVWAALSDIGFRCLCKYYGFGCMGDSFVFSSWNYWTFNVMIMMICIFLLPAKTKTKKKFNMALCKKEHKIK